MLKRIVGAIIRGLSFAAAKIIYRVEVIGLDNIPDDTGAIVCGNHVHALDAPALLATIRNKKTICFMTKAELFKNPFFRFIGSFYNVFPVTRSKADTDAIKQSLRIIKDKKVLGIFPEGTRNGMEKGVKPKNGAVNISIRTGAPIIPFAVIGNFKAFKKVKYVFGEPIDLSGYKENSHDKEVVDILTNELMAKIIELRDSEENVKISIDKK